MSFMIYFVLNTVFILIFSLFYYSTNPVNLGLLLLSSSVCIFIYLSLCLSSWLGLALMLVFSGGMMIVILYMTSLASGGCRELYWSKFQVFNISFLFMNSSIFDSWSFMENSSGFMSIFMSTNCGCMLFVILYLLFALFACVSIASLSDGALTKKFINKAWSIEPSDDAHLYYYF